jgi:hypothetical protein
MAEPIHEQVFIRKSLTAEYFLKYQNFQNYCPFDSKNKQNGQ